MWRHTQTVKKLSESRKSADSDQITKIHPKPKPNHKKNPPFKQDRTRMQNSGE